MERDPDAGLLEAELRARVADAPGPYDAAVWQLLLGDPDEGLATLRRGLGRLPSDGAASVHLAQVALVAGEGETARRLASTSAPEAVARYVAGSREFVGALVALIAGDEAAARSHQEALETFAASHDKLRGGQPSSVAALTRGLLDGDAALAGAGIEALLAWHVRRARTPSEVFNSSSGVVSLDAVVALLLAHRRALAVPVAATYRTADLPLLAIHVTEWDGRPLPRGRRLRIVTDLVAAPWLRAQGVEIDDPAPTTRRARPGASAPRPRAASTGDEAATARDVLRRRLGGAAHPWQHAGWALLLGDVEQARARLRAAAADARGRWQESLPRASGPLGWFRKDQALPNQNFVREHFALALVLGDEAGLRESTSQLQAWLRTQEGRGWPVYGHSSGYLDLICDLIGGGDRARPADEEVRQVSGPHASTRVAAIALAQRDPALLREGLEAILADHAESLDRPSISPPVSELAVHLAVAARRLGMPVTVDPRYAAWPVAVDGARLPADLLGRALWSGQG